MKKYFLILSLILLTTSVRAVEPGRANHEIWDNILQATVNEDGLVDYPGIRVNKGGDIYEYLTKLESYDCKTLLEDEKIAFWVNAYNAHVIAFILANPKMTKVDEDKTMFQKTFKVARLNLSLDDIENRVLRRDATKGGAYSFSVKQFDPRVDFVLVKGAMGSPHLWNHAYTGRNIQERLRIAAENFANSPEYLRVAGNQLIVNSTMKWYASDFDSLGGVAKYLMSLTTPARRSDEPEVDLWLKSDYPDKAVFVFDWAVNDVHTQKR